MNNRTKKPDNCKSGTKGWNVTYTNSGGIRVKQSDIAKTDYGKKLIRECANSKIAKQ